MARMWSCWGRGLGAAAPKARGGSRSGRDVRANADACATDGGRPSTCRRPSTFSGAYDHLCFQHVLRIHQSLLQGDFPIRIRLLPGLFRLRGPLDRGVVCSHCKQGALLHRLPTQPAFQRSWPWQPGVTLEMDTRVPRGVKAMYIENFRCVFCFTASPVAAGRRAATACDLAAVRTAPGAGPQAHSTGGPARLATHPSHTTPAGFQATKGTKPRGVPYALCAGAWLDPLAPLTRPQRPRSRWGLGLGSWQRTGSEPEWGYACPRAGWAVRDGRGATSAESGCCRRGRSVRRASPPGASSCPAQQCHRTAGHQGGAGIH